MAASTRPGAIPLAAKTGLLLYFNRLLAILKPTPTGHHRSTDVQPRAAEATFVRDLVAVQSHPTVVRLEHLDDQDANWISASYYLTDDVQSHLKSLRHRLAQPQGCGIFVIGHYGAGKSHLLAYIVQQLRNGAWGGELPAVALLSLLNFSADTRLEDIVANAVGVTTGHDDRRLAWSSLMARHDHGLLLVIDELSEFLRSKPSRQAFNEDVRFLQFLGEWAQGQRFWVIAAMQEQIEHTGDIEYSLYRKIKDRYPLRLLLTPAHVRDLVGHHILIKKAGYSAAVETLVKHLQEAFPSSPLDLAQLCDTYPIHPATLELLEEVRDRFSQARGIIDFTVNQLAGDPARGIDAFLDRPWGHLITPDFIVDHFQDLFELQAEFLPLGQKLLPYYRKHLTEMFSNASQRDLAWRILKLLVLTELSPTREDLSSDEAAHWLLYKATRIDPAKNLKIIQRVLDQLAEHGRYIKRHGQRYRLDLRDDSAAELERRLQREIAELQTQGDVLFETIAPLLPTDGFNPLTLPRDQWQNRTLRWHFHERHYAVYLGNGEPPPRPGIALCIRLPWGNAATAPGVYTLQPAPLTQRPEFVELAALARLRQHPSSRALLARVDRRIREHLALLQSEVKNAYHGATLSGPTGTEETPPHSDANTMLDPWLDGYGEWILRRTYPAFERFAPSHGPLPKEAYRRFMRFAATSDLGEYDADEYVKLIREAYLVPMGLLQRRGRDYVLPPRLDKNELVSLLLPLLEHRPSPKVVYDHLANPVYGLVPDQVHLLLLFLLIQGELDIVKDNRSLRELFETLPNPLQYDTIVAGRALTLEQLQALQQLCEGMNVRTPKQWTVTAQRHAVKQLRDQGRRHRERLNTLAVKLHKLDQGQALVDNLQRILNQWSALEQGSDELHGLQQFLYEIGSPRRFLAALAEWEGLPERIERLLSELQRYRHLFAHPLLVEAKDNDFAGYVRELGDAPAVDDPAALENWLGQAKALYQSYQANYQTCHDAWWQLQNEHPIWHWQPPPLARSRHLGLAEALRDVTACRERATQLRCRGLVDLQFQPVCRCGFAHDSAPIVEVLHRFEGVREMIENEVARFFHQEDVKSRVRDWHEKGLEVNTQTLAYLDGQEKLPKIDNLTLFDQHLTGLELVKEVSVNTVTDLLTERTWERSKLVAEFERLVARFGGQRVHFRKPAETQRIALWQWCAEHAVRYGIPLPSGLSTPELAAVSAALRPEYVEPATLNRLDRLGLDEEGQGHVIRWLLDGQLGTPPSESDSPLVAAALEIIHPTEPRHPEQLAQLSEALYRQHQPLLRITEKRWLARLDTLAKQPLAEPVAALVKVLEPLRDEQWLLIDCLGLALLNTLRAELDQMLPAWRLEDTRFALVSPETTTDACYRDLMAADLTPTLEKIDVVDQLLHQRNVAFDDLARLSVAELRIACKALIRRLDTRVPVVIFADHGFRLASDGRRYVHGGPSTLERVVPILRLTPI